MNVIDFIKLGRENAVSRAKLEHLTGQTDRANRDEIKALRNAGFKICSSSGGKGYFIGDDHDWELFQKECLRRAAATLEPFLQYQIVSVPTVYDGNCIFVRPYVRRRRKPPEAPKQIEGQTSF